MAITVEEASEAYQEGMRNVPPVGDGICATCHTFVNPAFSTCYPCGHQPANLDVVVPITYSMHGGQMHDALRYYKDGVAQVRRHHSVRLAAILWRFIANHENCVARAGETDGFELVTSVPSTTPERDEAGHLRRLIGWCEPLSERYERVLRATGEAPGRGYDERRYRVEGDVDGLSVLLIDDTWVAGGHAQSAAASLRAERAARVSLVVIGRHLQPTWEPFAGTSSAELFEAMPHEFDWGHCPVCAG